MFPLAQRLGLNRRVSMTCFDNVLWLTGNTNERYLETPCGSCVRNHPRRPLAEGRLFRVQHVAAIIAAKVERRSLLRNDELIPQPQAVYASDPATANGESVLRSLSMGEVRSPEDVLLCRAGAFVPSCHALEPS